MGLTTFILSEQEETPLEEIYFALTEGKKPKDPVSTKADMAFDENFLHQLDKSCMEVSQHIVSK